MRKVIERLILSEKVDNSLDVRFWQKAGVQARFSALWIMISEFYKIKGKNGNKLRLQRSVQNIKQI